MALGHYMCHQFGKSTKSKGSSPAESTYQTDARWRRTAREGLRAWVRNIKLPGSKELGRCLFSSDGKGVVKVVMLDNSPAGIMIVRFPVELEHRRAKVPLQLLPVAFLLVIAPSCHLSLVLVSVVRGDAVNCNRGHVDAQRHANCSEQCFKCFPTHLSWDRQPAIFLNFEAAK